MLYAYFKNHNQAFYVVTRKILLKDEYALQLVCINLRGIGLACCKFVQKLQAELELTALNVIQSTDQHL